MVELYRFLVFWWGNGRFGNEGEIAYEATDAVSGVNLLTYNATGFMGNESTSLKFGLYRRANPAMREAM